MKMIRSLAKQLPHPLLFRLYHHTRLREESPRATKAAALSGLPLLETLDIESLRASDTLFALGSAWSINDIADERWRIIGRHDSVGINFWPVHPFVPRFFHFENMSHGEQPEMYERRPANATAFPDSKALRMGSYTSSLYSGVTVVLQVWPPGWCKVMLRVGSRPCSRARSGRTKRRGSA